MTISSVLWSTLVGYLFSLGYRTWVRRAERRIAAEAAEGNALIAAAESGQVREAQGRCKACGVVCWGSYAVKAYRPRWPGWEECSETPGLWHHTGKRSIQPHDRLLDDDA